MNIIETIFLGIIQGLTEFLPISSSGHLVLFQHLLGFRKPELLLDCSLHFGTLVAICIYFRADLYRMIEQTGRFVGAFLFRRNRLPSEGISDYTSLALWVLVGSIPTACIGLLFRDFFEGLFASVTVVAVMLIFTGLILASTRIAAKGYGRRNRVGLLASLAVGTAQGLAIIPGISRSGTTIACGLLFGLDRDLAGRFSFILSIPAIFGALVLQLFDETKGSVETVPLIVGAVVSTLVGLMSLKILMRLVRQGHLFYFAPYCWVLGIVVMILN
jgi:undecaprenyl-diphosphatase